MTTRPAEFDSFASDYRSIHSDNIKFSGVESEYFCEHKIIELKKIESKPGIHMLDLGCGDGTTARFFIKHFPDGYYHGIDISGESIRQAQQLDLDRCIFDHFDGHKIPFDNSSFDLVLVANVFHHIEKRNHIQILHEISRVLVKNGQLIIFEHNPINPVTQWIVKTCVFDKNAELLRPTHFKSCFAQSGYSVINIKYLLFFPRIYIFRWLIKLEDRFGKLPFGAQYLIVGQKKD